MVSQYVTKLHRQHTSVVTSVPRGVQRALELKSGEHLVWQVNEACQFVQVSKVVPGGQYRGKDNVGSGREDQGRRLRAEDRG